MKTKYLLPILGALLIAGCSEAPAPVATDPIKVETPAPSPAPVESAGVTISKAEYDQLENGMSYKKVVALVGGEGEQLSETGSPGEEFYTAMYSYDGEGGLGANVSLIFQDDKLMTKSQFGLK